MVGVIPSTLHQQLNNIVNGNLVTISAEPDYPSHIKGDIPMISLDEAIELASFQDFEVGTAHYPPLGISTLKPKVFLEVMYVAHEMITRQF